MPVDNPDLTGRELGDYRVLRRLGAGGMAEVYLAEQRSLSRQVALKVLPPALACNGAYVDRFLNEARAAAALVHANIVQIYEVGQADGVHFIAQEYVRGKNLGDVLKRQSSLQPGTVLDVLRQVAAGLCKAAEAGIVHRDIKPENILLGTAGEVKVADFGLARVQTADAKSLTEAGVAMGTPLYMSPEQIEGRAVDARSDIYSLGVTCYHLLAGVPPHTGETALAIAVQHLSSAPLPLENARPDVPSGLARVIHRMIAKKPESRYQTPAELLADLRKLAGDAAAQGWGEGAENWSMADWIASTAPSAATAELDRLMREDAQLQQRSRGRRSVAAALLAAAMAGAAIGYVTMPGSYLEQPAVTAVERRASPLAQIYYAKVNPSEAAWLAVEEYFPNLDPFERDLAREGLARYYLMLSQEFGKARTFLLLLKDSPASEGAQSRLHDFVYAGLVVAYQRLEDYAAAAEAASHLTPAMRDRLRRTDAPMYQLLQSALRSLGT